MHSNTGFRGRPMDLKRLAAERAAMFHDTAVRVYRIAV